MGITVAVVRVACNTGTGTQDITTTDLGGLTPKAALFIGSSCITDAAAAAHNVLCYGVAVDATHRWVQAATDKDAVADSDTDHFFDDDFCVLFTNPGAQTVDGSADFSAWITNGITINWTDAPAGAYLLTVVFFAGSDLSAYADAPTLGNLQGTATDITAPGFQPDVVLGVIASIGFSGTDGNAVQYCWLPGIADDTSVQRGLGLTYQNNGAAAGDVSYYNSTYFLARSSPAGTGNPSRAVTIGTFDSSGFTLTESVGATSGVGYLALAFGGAVSYWVGTVTSPTGTGNNAQTGPGFKPQFVMMNLSGVEASATIYTDGRAGIGGVSVITATDQESTAWASEDAATTMNTQSLADNQAINLPAHDGASTIAAATFVSMDATGWTLNYSTAPATAKVWPALAIGANKSFVPLPQMRMPHALLAQ